MLYFGSKLVNTGLFSIRSSGKIGEVNGPLINPHNLHIDGFYCKTHNGQYSGLVLDIDVRDLSAKGLIINNHEDISDPAELVRLTSIIEINYQLIGKPVYSGKSKIGKVLDYVFDDKSLYVKALHVQPSLLKSFGANHLIIDRQSIIEVTDSRITVSSGEQKQTSSLHQKFSPASLNSASTSAMSE
jgi:sporulation protein YlmC with PRC-barrel domain